MKSYTLVELMIVMLIVAILSAIAVPLIRGRVDSAKWAEGKTIAGIIVVAIRTWSIGTTENGTWDQDSLRAVKLGLRDDDLNGVYFAKEDFEWQVSFYNGNLSYSVTVSKGEGINTGPEERTLDETGHWDQ